MEGFNYKKEENPANSFMHGFLTFTSFVLFLTMGLWSIDYDPLGVNSGSIITYMLFASLCFSSWVWNVLKTLRLGRSFERAAEEYCNNCMSTGNWLLVAFTFLTGLPMCLVFCSGAYTLRLARGLYESFSFSPEKVLTEKERLEVELEASRLKTSAVEAENAELQKMLCEHLSGSA